ncbi:MAG: TonB-dependent receptor [Paludibacteraceae bacterium]|nr:TonB-dependent receptor [Paludibacteraceae bacterium]
MRSILQLNLKKQNTNKTTQTIGRKFFVLISVCILFFSTLSAQAQTQVSGQITDASNGGTLPGVNVMIKGTTTGTISDFDGRFSLTVNSTADVLIFSFIGYKTQEVPVGTNSVVNVVLELSDVGLDEVVIVGYGTMKKRDVTGSIVSIEQEQMTEVKSGNVLESLQGKIAGADITRDDGRSGAGVGILIRGKRSLNAANGPLVIVDGVPYGDNIDINQNDIESIEVLKDASSTAIYGSRGANGVILITTKKGAAGKAKIYFNAYYGISQPYQHVPVFNREGYIKAKIDAYRDVNDWGTIPEMYNVFPGDELTGYENGTDTDWQDIVTKNGTRQDYHIGVSGGSELVSYNTSLNYYHEEGVVLSDEFDRYTFRLNFDSKPTNFLKIGSSSLISYKERNGRGPRFTDAVLLSPIVEAYNEDGTYKYQPNFANPRKSPLAYTFDEEETRDVRVFSTVYAQVDFLNNFNFRTNLGVDLSTSRFGYMYPQKSEGEEVTASGVTTGNDLAATWTNLLNYNKEMGDHTVYVTLGHELQFSRYEDFGMYGDTQDFDRSLWYNFSTNKNATSTSYLEKRALVSAFTRVSYNYKSRYLLNLTARADGASQLAEGNKWDYFPAASIAWRVNEESFMNQFSFISDLKLRSGYGVSGNASVDPYSTAATLNVKPLYVQFGEPGTESTYFGYRPETLSSSSLCWERTTQFNIGVDFGIFDNRIVGNLDVYKANTVDLLLQDKLPLSSSFFSVWTNAGETETKGLELVLQTVNFDKAGFKWSTDLTFSASREKIVALASGLTRDEANNWFVGEPLDVYYNFEKIGIWQLEDAELAAKNNQEPGDIRVNDVDKNDTINYDDRVILGTSRPKWTANLVNRFDYKGFDLTVSIYARMGQMIDAGAYAFDPRMYDNMLEVDYWTPENPTNEYPRMNAKEAEADYEYTLRYRDGSFIKLKNITFGYNVPSKFISAAKISKLRVYFSSNNPFILYSELKEGLDPERNGSISWPTARTFVFGVNLDF